MAIDYPWHPELHADHLVHGVHFEYTYTVEDYTAANGSPVIRIYRVPLGAERLGVPASSLPPESP
jgi:hypothetical protein